MAFKANCQGCHVPKNGTYACLCNDEMSEPPDSLTSLLDSGCENSVIGRRYLRGASMKHTRYALSAVNKTALSIDGDVDLHFTMEGHAMTANVSMSPAIDELLLSRDWLFENNCRWDFAQEPYIISEIHAHRREQVDTSLPTRLRFGPFQRHLTSTVSSWQPFLIDLSDIH